MIQGENMFKDIVYMHEHITIDLSKEKNSPDCKLDLFDDTVEELLQLKNRGVSTVVDLTNIGMGRDVAYVERVEKATGIKILMSTGYYKEPFLPEEVSHLTTEELAEKMIFEIEKGIDGTSKKATFIGEIGTGFKEITPLEEKLFKAATIAQKATGKYISTHTSLGKLGHEQLNLIESQGGDLTKVILGHTDLSGDLPYIESLLERGVYIAFDTVGKNSYLPDEKRVEYIKYLCDKGYEDKLLLSVDLTRKSHLKNSGGIGYLYLLDVFIPKLQEAGISEEILRKIMVENPKKIIES